TSVRCPARSTACTSAFSSQSRFSLYRPPTSSPSSLLFFTAPATPPIYTLSLHDALPISSRATPPRSPTTTAACPNRRPSPTASRSEEHTSELQSRRDLVCRLLLEKKKNNCSCRLGTASSE